MFLEDKEASGGLILVFVSSCIIYAYILITNEGTRELSNNTVDYQKTALFVWDNENIKPISQLSFRKRRNVLLFSS